MRECVEGGWRWGEYGAGKGGDMRVWVSGGTGEMARRGQKWIWSGVHCGLCACELLMLVSVSLLHKGAMGSPSDLCLSPIAQNSIVIRRLLWGIGSGSGASERDPSHGSRSAAIRVDGLCGLGSGIRDHAKWMLQGLVTWDKSANLIAVNSIIST